MLFDKNGFYMLNDEFMNPDYDFAIDIINGTSGSYDNFKIYDLKEALTKGNLFPKLYDPYKNYSQKLPACQSGRESALLEIQMLDFSINDLNLYLDLNPDDKYAYKIFEDYVKKCKKKKEEFKRVYGPLCLDELTDEYEWSKGVWPWEGGSI